MDRRPDPRRTAPRTFDRAMRSRLTGPAPVLGVALLIAALALPGAVFAQAGSTPTGEPAPGAGQPSAGDRFQVPPDFERTADEATFAAKLVELRGMLPEDLRRPTGMTVEELHALVDETLRLGEAYLSRFPEGETRKDVLPGLAKLWVVNNTRYFIQVSQEIQQRTGSSASLDTMSEVRARYFGKVLGMIDEALQSHSEGSVNQELLQLRGQACYFAQRYDGAIEAYRQLTERYPDADDAAENLLALLNAHLGARRYDEAVVVADRFFVLYPRDELAPHVYQLKGKALTEGGKARESLAWWTSIGDVLEAGAAGRPVEIGGVPHVWSGEARKAFQRYVDERGFMIGFLNGVLGRYDEARKWLARTIERLTELQAQGKIDPRSQVFLSRTDKVHGAMLTLVGDFAPDLSIGAWLDDVPLDPIAERGNVQVLLFAPYENPRYLEFEQILQRFYQRHWHEGLRVAWISDPKGFNDIPGQLTRVDAQRRRLELSYPVGLETEKNWPNYKRYQASVGGGSLVVIDRAGKVAWYKMDPTYRDENLLSGLIERLLSAPATAGDEAAPAAGSGGEGAAAGGSGEEGGSPKRP